MMPVEPEAETSDRDEVASLDDELEIYTGMRQAKCFPSVKMTRADQISKPVCEAAQKGDFCNFAQETT